MRGVDRDASLTTAQFRLGVWLAQHGVRAGRAGAFEEAVRLAPEAWRFRRQKIALSDPALTGQLASTPGFWQAGQPYKRSATATTTHPPRWRDAPPLSLR